MGRDHIISVWHRDDMYFNLVPFPRIDTMRPGLRLSLFSIYACDRDYFNYGHVLSLRYAYLRHAIWVLM